MCSSHATIHENDLVEVRMFESLSFDRFQEAEAMLWFQGSVEHPRIVSFNSFFFS